MSEIIKANPEVVKKFEALKASIEKQTEILKKIKLTDANSVGTANQQLSAAGQLEKSVEEKRKLLKQPSIDEGKAIDNLAKELTKNLSDEMLQLKQRMLTYDQKQKELAKQDQDKLRDRIARFTAEAFSKIHAASTLKELSFAFAAFVKSYPKEYGDVLLDQIKELGKAKQRCLNVAHVTDPDIDEMEVVENYHRLYKKLTEPEEDPLPVFDVMPVIVPAATGIKTKKTWKFEVVNHNLLPRSWLTLNEALVKEYMSNNKDKLKDGEIFNGVKFFTEETVVRR